MLMRYSLPALAFLFVVPAATQAAVILTSGTFDQSYGAGDNIFPPIGGSFYSLTGDNFFLDASRPQFATFDPSRVLSCALDLPNAIDTCTVNMSGSFPLSSIVFAFPSSSFTYNGVSYPVAQVSIAMAFTSSIVQVTELCNPSQSIFKFNCVGTVANIPFTVTGSFTIMNGSTVIASDTLSGHGLASFSGQNNDDGYGMQATYVFSSVPEPSSIGLVASGLFAAGWLNRRGRAARRPRQS